MEWKEVVTDADVQTFLEENLYLHDSCILRAEYTTSTRVAENGSMYPFNDRCLLTIELQQQRAGRSCIALRFQDVVVFHIQPRSGQYESIIYDTTLVKKGRPALLDRFCRRPCGKSLPENRLHRPGKGLGHLGGGPENVLVHPEIVAPRLLMPRRPVPPGCWSMRPGPQMDTRYRRAVNALKKTGK